MGLTVFTGIQYDLFIMLLICYQRLISNNSEFVTAYVPTFFFFFLVFLLLVFRFVIFPLVTFRFVVFLFVFRFPFVFLLVALFFFTGDLRGLATFLTSVFELGISS